MSGRFWILDGQGEPVEVDDVLTFGRWFEDAKQRVVAQTVVDGQMVSTVFLGINHCWNDDAPPILWETMIFEGPHDGFQVRYSTRQAAVAGHDQAVAALRRGEDP